MKAVLDQTLKNGLLTQISMHRDGKDKTLVVNTVQDVEENLRNNAAMRSASTVKGTDNQAHMRIVADVPMAIYRSWINLYGFDMLSHSKSNWGQGMTKEQHKRFLRSLLNSNPALKTVDERL